MIDPSIWRRAAPAVALVSTMTVAVVAGLLIGGWVDAKLGTSPLFTGGLALAGFVAAIRRMMQVSSQNPPDEPPQAPPR